ncbi:AMP-binding protein [Rhizobium alvei]|uniref:AMP-binding protein n=1 Tax=Rhizobium alvei TaxID=1132659 RepID=A0ABT8YUZ2_9HYPH|nr:AMP-binding protein [Rhizobium alvei]MDO6967112.1 AMP-binding protein [Rhizobium alvei]
MIHPEVDYSIFYLSGGTTSRPKIIEYNALRWKQSTAVKARLMRAWGVDHSARVAVCHPFSPWAMGQVFVEGALHCGAKVLPLGLEANQRPIFEYLKQFDPTHFCATASNLARWGRAFEPFAGSRGPKSRVVLTGGEKLTPAKRAAVEQLWDIQAVDIYGMAEFDMIASELPERTGLWLVPEYNYFIRAAEGVTEGICDQAEGELCLCVPGGGVHATGDLVRVLSSGLVKEYDWHESFAIEVLGRINETASTSDGAMITSAHVVAIIEEIPELEAIQILIDHRVDGDEISIITELKSGLRMQPEIRQRLMSVFTDCNIDISDSIRHGIVAAVAVHSVLERPFITTRRGKTPRVLELYNGGLQP